MFNQAWHFLARVDVAAAFLFLVLILAALGSCFPQLPATIAADAERLAAWENEVETRYGSLTPFLKAIDAFQWFRSPTFRLSAALMALSTLACTLNRWRRVWRTALHRPVQRSDKFFDNAPHTAELSRAAEDDWTDGVRDALKQRGFRVCSESGGGVNHLRGDRYGWAHVATLITHLAALLLLAGVALSGAASWREEIEVAPDETVNIGHGTGLAVRSENFTMTHYADGSVAGYEADVAVLDELEEDTAQGSIRLNQPLIYENVGLYLQSYAEAGNDYRLTLLAVHDPGFVPVILAATLMFLGLTVSFNFPPCCVHARIEPDGMLHLAGRSTRRAWDFEREFAALVEEVSASR